MIDLIPAIDIIDGKCVRLTQGDFNHQTNYNIEPLEVAKNYQNTGIKQLHLVQLDNAKLGMIKELKVLETIASQTTLRVDYGGGIKSIEDIKRILDAGAHQVNIGSWAVKDPDNFTRALSTFGDKIILSADVRNGKVSVSGWQEDSNIELDDFIAGYIPKGLKYVTSTDISKDGAMMGPATDLYIHLKKKFPELYITASGGVSTLNDITALNEAQIDGVIIGKALYEGAFTIQELTKEFGYA
ncbi:MAG: 1-(5-phosphoribosyl)-5-[(5-phosphoribosylamino)methylideneamino]imidazole-4-carboxamide isomerase [Cyclobacteriaceae bacterium]|nr:1-(5-phosphoribosyl)-5-[(5-phosphoribosylamino)methylideneamino]imidazole-4-carboxamide isomerase [Cyclobacteriaceae bacterium]